MTESSALQGFHNEPPEKGFIAHKGARDHSRFLISFARPEPDRPIIHDERKWRQPDILETVDHDNSRMVVSRWEGMDRKEHSFEIAGNYHILATTLQPSKFSLWLGTKLFSHHEVVPGVIQITPPGVQARVVHSGPYDFLHFHIPNLLLMECFEWSHGKWPAEGVTLRDPLPARDEQLQKLVTTLLAIAEADDSNGSLSADFLGLAIATHVLGLYGDIAPPTVRKSTALPKWRLNRAKEFIDMHLDSPLALADVAGAAGLSRTHFAAQFRAATGVSAHEYVLRRRIEKAQTMLATTDVPLAELALAIGFSSQAHFTEVFKRLSGSTPRRWRQSHRT